MAAKSTAVAAALVLAVQVVPASAQTLSVDISVNPQIPVVVTAGQTGVQAGMSITNRASTPGVPITVTAITYDPSCGSLSLDCVPPEPGVFALSSGATGVADACTGRTFSVVGPDGSGRYVLAPDAPIVLQSPGQAGSTCEIAFTITVLKVPQFDAQPSVSGQQTAAVAVVTASAQLGANLSATGVARGLRTTNVNRAQPVLATQVGGSRAAGGTIVDVATLSGPLAITGAVTFKAYGPGDPSCSASPVFSSTGPVDAGRSTSGPFTAPGPGTYRFVAAYSGDADNLPVTGNCVDPAEAVLVQAGPGRYIPLTPARILDTRDGTGGAAGPLGPGSTIDVQVTGRGGVPVGGASAVAMNVTATQPTAVGYLTLFPAGSDAVPSVSNVNFIPGQTVPNLVVLKLGPTGGVSLFNASGDTHVIFDVAGWFSADGSGDDGLFQSMVPGRILDTRSGIGGATRLGPGETLDVPVAGRAGVPITGAKAAVLNVALTGTTASSYLTVFPTGEPRPLASNLNVNAGDTVSNRVMAKLGMGGMVSIYNPFGSTDVVVDLNGWYTDGSVAMEAGVYTPVAPKRIVDTRLGIGGPVGSVPAGVTFDVQVTGLAGVPTTGVRAVILNVTATQPAGAGYISLFPTGTATPASSDLNFAAVGSRPNLTVVQLGVGGRVSLVTSTTTHVILDVSGWFS